MVPRALLVFLLALLPGFAIAQIEPDRLRIDGSNTLGARLVPTMVTVWLKQTGYTNIKRQEPSAVRTEITATGNSGVPIIVDIDKSGTASGFAALIKGDADVAMSDRQPNAKETAAAWQLGDLKSPDEESVVALTGLIVVASPNNPVSSLSESQLRDVFTGKINDWSELGGSPGPIIPCSQQSGSGESEQLSTMVLDGAKVGPTTALYGSNAEIVAAVAADPSRLGIVEVRAARKGVKPVAIRVGTQSIAPDEAAVRSEDYPLVHRLYLYKGQVASALGRGFAEFAISPAGQALVGRSEFVSLDLRLDDASPLASDDPEYKKFTSNAGRITTTLHFSSGQDMFDSRGRQDMARLVSLLHGAGGTQQKQVMLAGFANPDPKLQLHAIEISNQRADSVSSEMTTLGMKVVKARGFGGSKLLTDPDQAAARYRNERVEVWVQR